MNANKPSADLAFHDQSLSAATSEQVRTFAEPLQPEVKLLLRMVTYYRLGLGNVVRVAIHRVCKRAGIYKWLLPRRKAAPLEFRIDPLLDTVPGSMPWIDPAVLAEADRLLAGKAAYFSVHLRDIGSPPSWFLNPFRNIQHPQSTAHWSEISDFDSEIGDIKAIWETSRFSWALVFARAWRTSGDSRYLIALQSWLQHWWCCNPPNTGPNWMCGQETAIRLMNLLLALRIAGAEKNVTGLAAFVEAHCRRIDFTTFYAAAQDNNHATSEAAGLFVGGTWLATYGDADARSRGRRWAAKGRKLLVRGVNRLILPDGSFSQHSVTYHRLMLETLSIAETWRRCLREEPFSQRFYSNAVAATRWLGAMIEPLNGDVPNLGANDGAKPFRLDSSAFRDFRPCLQLASFLFVGGAAFEPGPWNESCTWLSACADGTAARPWLSDLSSVVFADGGYVIIRNNPDARVLLRAPTARFRPAHADALHVDFWWRGTNLLRDGGTYAYSAVGSVAEALASVAGHNLAQFDDHDQMPKISRFLYGKWVRVVGAPMITNAPSEQSWTGTYTDFCGVRHKRTVALKADELSVRDQIQGFKRKAVLRWRLSPGNWHLNGSECASAMGRICVESSVPIRRMSLESGWESLHYLEKSAVPVLEIEISQSPAHLTTTITPS